VAIRQEPELLATLSVDRAAPLNPEEEHLLDSLALEAAVVINDARLRSDAVTWQGCLDELLSFDERIEGSEVVKRLGE